MLNVGTLHILGGADNRDLSISIAVLADSLNAQMHIKLEFSLLSVVFSVRTA